MSYFKECRFPRFVPAPGKRSNPQLPPNPDPPSIRGRLSSIGARSLPPNIEEATFTHIDRTILRMQQTLPSGRRSLRNAQPHLPTRYYRPQRPPAFLEENNAGRSGLRLRPPPFRVKFSGAAEAGAFDTGATLVIPPVFVTWVPPHKPHPAPGNPSPPWDHVTPPRDHVTPPRDRPSLRGRPSQNESLPTQ